MNSHRSVKVVFVPPPRHNLKYSCILLYVHCTSLPTFNRHSNHTMRDPYIERPLLGSEGMAKVERSSRDNQSVSMKTLFLSMLFGIIFVALLAGNVYQNALIGGQTGPSIRLRYATEGSVNLITFEKYIFC